MTRPTGDVLVMTMGRIDLKQTSNIKMKALERLIYKPPGNRLAYVSDQ